MLLIGLYPRALPPVTYSSALQAPERIWRPSVVVKNPEDECLSLFIALRWMQDPNGEMVGLTENVRALLEDFLAATASMDRKRHLASSARGFYGFCLLTSQDRCLTWRSAAWRAVRQRTGSFTNTDMTDKTDIF